MKMLESVNHFIEKNKNRHPEGAQKRQKESLKNFFAIGNLVGIFSFCIIRRSFCS